VIRLGTRHGPPVTRIAEIELDLKDAWLLQRGRRARP
jgi:hypothetical protein